MGEKVNGAGQPQKERERGGGGGVADDGRLPTALTDTWLERGLLGAVGEDGRHTGSCPFLFPPPGQAEVGAGGEPGRHETQDTSAPRSEPGGPTCDGCSRGDGTVSEYRELPRALRTKNHS